MADCENFAADLSGELWPDVATDAAQATHAVYEQFRTIIHAYLVSLKIEPERAKDLTQECFIKFYLSVRAGDRIREPRPWLFKTASRLALNHFRDLRSKDTVSTEDLTDHQLNARSQMTSIEDHLIESDRLDRLADAFQSLSPQQQICLHLRAEGLRYREIAEALEVSVPTVSEFIRRGIARLRRTLDA